MLLHLISTLLIAKRSRMNSRSLHILIIALCFTTGCGKEVEEYVPPPARENLEVLGSAYSSYVFENGRAPSSQDDLSSILEEWQEDEAAIFKSPRDGQEFVVIWDVDIANAELRDDSTPIIAYEKTSNEEGNRFVTNGRETFEVSDEDFRSLYFPAGHTP